ncbi:MULTISPECIES: type II secretion system major pseudopilin GspG [unclassified Novosphingobium]|uniref:type II secretion system major pseudopilin GspG n=1 Tax=unclassified Novosphingobium TaxID=2644732 RepID=UPI0014942E6D|nr:MULTISPECIES: type II secretion system major pseudopilin GspG [unclassified Novosphingobium]MBB3372991.1 general secretion pathway protein G [Novosphingobium sp. BK280]MBB3419230.1 general secretion pathway protein G [Novosphingobium sp. BK267]MBB3448953.1 general secretion pathway protein G [Novosphingobium sp. BK352]MBB3476276.1 general secretion pathway protein G [Novosphingobium sp. BK369]MBB3535496.1 general secretion pathway protein G [Novosphingobium sp. BK486]
MAVVHAHPRRPAPNGFSLVELMVVIFILGLLTTVVLINVMPSQDRAMAVKAQSDIATLEQALEMFRLDQGSYPSQAQGLAALREAPPDLAVPETWRKGGYIQRLPKDPWGRPYLYRVPGRDGAPFALMSLGADGQPGGSGANADIVAQGQGG